MLIKSEPKLQCDHVTTQKNRNTVKETYGLIKYIRHTHTFLLVRLNNTESSMWFGMSFCFQLFISNYTDKDKISKLQSYYNYVYAIEDWTMRDRRGTTAKPTINIKFKLIYNEH